MGTGQEKLIYILLQATERHLGRQMSTLKGLQSQVNCTKKYRGTYVRNNDFILVKDKTGEIHQSEIQTNKSKINRQPHGLKRKKNSTVNTIKNT